MFGSRNWRTKPRKERNYGVTHRVSQVAGYATGTNYMYDTESRFCNQFSACVIAWSICTKLGRHVCAVWLSNLIRCVSFVFVYYNLLLVLHCTCTINLCSFLSVNIIHVHYGRPQEFLQGWAKSTHPFPLHTSLSFSLPCFLISSFLFPLSAILSPLCRKWDPFSPTRWSARTL